MGTTRLPVDPEHVSCASSITTTSRLPAPPCRSFSTLSSSSNVFAHVVPVIPDPMIAVRDQRHGSSRWTNTHRRPRQQEAYLWTHASQSVREALSRMTLSVLVWATQHKAPPLPFRKRSQLLSAKDERCRYPSRLEMKDQEMARYGQGHRFLTLVDAHGSLSAQSYRVVGLQRWTFKQHARIPL